MKIRQNDFVQNYVKNSSWSLLCIWIVAVAFRFAEKFLEEGEPYDFFAPPWVAYWKVAWPSE